MMRATRTVSHKQKPAMSWKYTLSSSHAVHIETGEKFAIHYVGGTVNSSEDFELVPLPGSAANWTEADLDALREELWAAMREAFEQANLRDKLAALVKNPLIGDPYQAADVIARISGKNVSQRSVQAWLVDPDKSSSRKCPDWAVQALESYLAEPENQKRLRDLLKYYKPAAAPPVDAWAELVPSHARRSLPVDPRRQDEWQAAPLAALPGMLYEMEQRMDAYWHYFQQSLNAITATVLEEDLDLHEIRRRLRDKLDELRPLEQQLRDRPTGPDGLDGVD